MLNNALTNGHKQIHQTLGALKQATRTAKSKSTEIRSAANEKYDEAKAKWQKIDNTVHKNPWMAVASVAAAGALVGFCAGLLKRK